MDSPRVIHGPVTYQIGVNGAFDIEASINGRRVAYLWCEQERERLKISDLHVDAAHRGKGIGTTLLDLMFAEADHAGVVEIRGLVTADDLHRWGGLLGWYQGLGFSVMEPDGPDLKDLPTAIKKIVRHARDSGGR